MDGLEAERAYFAQRETEKRQAEASGEQEKLVEVFCRLYLLRNQEVERDAKRLICEIYLTIPPLTTGNRSLTSSPHCITGAISPQSAATCKVGKAG